MRFAALAFVSLAVALPAQAQSAPKQPGEVFTELAGSCWRTLMDGKGPDTDTHCFEVAVGGAMAADTHKVRNPKGEVVYEGVTIYRLDKASGALGYDYYNSQAMLLKGYGRREGDQIRFYSATDAKTPDIVWTLKGDHYEVAPASGDKGHPGKFVKVK